MSKRSLNFLEDEVLRIQRDLSDTASRIRLELPRDGELSSQLEEIDKRMTKVFIHLETEYRREEK